MTEQERRRKARAFYLARDLKHAIPIVRRTARKAKALGGKICSDNVWNAIETGTLLPAYQDRRYRSALMGRAMKEAARLGYTKPAGTTRNRYGSLVVAWRAA